MRKKQNKFFKNNKLTKHLIKRVIWRICTQGIRPKKGFINWLKSLKAYYKAWKETRFLSKYAFLLHHFLHCFFLLEQIYDQKSVQKFHFTEMLVIFYFKMDKQLQWSKNIRDCKKRHQFQQIATRIGQNQIKPAVHFSWTEKTPALETQNIDENILAEIKKPAFWLANACQFFFSTVLKKTTPKDLQKAYDLGFYLGFILYLQYFKFQKQQNNYSYFALNDTIAMKKNTLFLISKMFVSLKYIEHLRYFFPKTYNIFVMHFIRAHKF